MILEEISFLRVHILQVRLETLMAIEDISAKLTARDLPEHPLVGFFQDERDLVVDIEGSPIDNVEKRPTEQKEAWDNLTPILSNYMDCKYAVLGSVFWRIYNFSQSKILQLNRKARRKNEL